jgi:succinate dehydrogenase/fumarate reductase flavoprotein subunit
VTRKYEIGQKRLAEVREDLEQHMMARNAHELLRALEASSILDCADMAAHASLYRTESRWGLYHLRAEYPEKNNEDWFCHTLLRKQDGRMVSEKHVVQPYVVPIAEDEKDLYDKQRVRVSV